nr:hypothetical protein [Pseudomonas fluorescens]
MVQAGFGIALAQLAEQHLPGLGDQLRVSLDAPLGVRGQVLGIELPQAWHQALPHMRGSIECESFILSDFALLCALPLRDGCDVLEVIGQRLRPRALGGV